MAKKYTEVEPDMTPEEKERYDRIAQLGESGVLPSKEDTRFLLQLARRSIAAGSKPEPKVRHLIKILENEIRRSDAREKTQQKQQ